MTMLGVGKLNQLKHGDLFCKLSFHLMKKGQGMPDNMDHHRTLVVEKGLKLGVELYRAAAKY